MKERPVRRRLMASLAMVATLLFLVLPTGPAAARETGARLRTTVFSDLARGHPYERDILMLAALGIYGGRNGRAFPDEPVTRAEFSAVLVRMVGRENLARALSAIRPGFRDGIPEWAWGYVNVASGMGVVRGYPGGDFRAGEPVTRVEALSMLVRALGQDYFATEPWPAGDLAVARELGIAGEGERWQANRPLTGGEMAGYIVRALTTTRRYTERGRLADIQAPLLEARLNATLFSGAVSEVGPARIMVGKVSRPLDSTVILHGASSLDGLLDLGVRGLARDGRVVYIEVVETPAVVSGRLRQVEGVHLGLLDGRRFRLADNLRSFVVNARSRTALRNAQVASTLGGLLDAGLPVDVRLVLTEVGVTRVTAQVVDVQNARLRTDPVATRVGADVVATAFLASAGSLHRNEPHVRFVLEITEDTRVTLNGVPVGWNQLQANDIVNVATFDAGGASAGRALAIEALRRTVAGRYRGWALVSAPVTYFEVEIEHFDGSVGRYRVDGAPRGAEDGPELNEIVLPVGTHVRYALNSAGELRYLIERW